jgi:amino acid permease
MKESAMGNVLPIVSMVAGIGAGTLAFISSRQQPEKQRQLRAVGAFCFGIAIVMGLLMML